MKQALLVGSLVVGLSNLAFAQGSEVYTRWGTSGSTISLAADTQVFQYDATVSESTLASVATLEVYHNGVLKCVRTQLGDPMLPLNFSAQVDMASWGLRAGDTVTFRLKVSAIGTGQILIVSVVGTPEPGRDAEALIEDYARCAAWAAESGADAIEVHLAVPNPTSDQPQMVFESIPLSAQILYRVRSLVHVPVIAKLGAFRTPRLLHETATKLAPWADARWYWASVEFHRVT